MLYLSYFYLGFLERILLWRFCWMCMKKLFEKVQRKHFYSIYKCTAVFKLKILTSQKCLVKMLFCLFISNYSNSVLLLSIFVLLHKQEKLIITHKKNKKENSRYIIEVNKKVQCTFQGLSESTLMLLYSNFYSVPFFFIF